ncbi:prospero homeobox protein [Pimephales promelas]|nr:prospero homeobox protein [Pimephales promelas]
MALATPTPQDRDQSARRRERSLSVKRLQSNRLLRLRQTVTSMNLSPAEQSDGCAEGNRSEQMLPCFRRSAYDEHLAPYNGSVISHLLRKTIHSKLSSLDMLYCANESGATDEEQSGGEDLSTDVEQHLQAKRARVENIIRGMAGSHGDPDRDCESARSRRDKRKQKLPLHQEPDAKPKTSKDEECHKLKEQLQSMQRLLHQLQEKISHVYDSEGEPKPGLSRESTAKNLQETLKCELTRTVSESIDSVFKKLAMSPSASPEYKPSQDDSRSEISDSEEVGREHFESDSQTEALSLVVRKPSQSQVIPGVKRPFPLHQTPFQFGYNTPLHDSQILEHLLKYGPHSAFSGLPCVPASLERASPDSMEHSWESVAMRSKVHHLGQHHHHPAGLVPVDSLCLPHVKMECADLQSMERSSFMALNIQEGLTPNHLKKAKLMFFYTRYPSSNLLKNFFPDVKFNRCITSQLIKWFSNFREFYYIQMEKFARQAIIDGVTDVKDISITRESELFRALNMHYNKANDFQVPERFLEVAEITLQEFFSAVSLSKDSDPSWKKAIYKVICKLDSDVPEDFKSPSYL